MTDLDDRPPRTSAESALLTSERRVNIKVTLGLDLKAIYLR
jgi:hypothetical protein